MRSKRQNGVEHRKQARSEPSLPWRPPNIRAHPGIILLAGQGFASFAFDFEPVAMIIDHALNLIKSCADQMNARYKKVVFDETVIFCKNSIFWTKITYFRSFEVNFEFF